MPRKTVKAPEVGVFSGDYDPDLVDLLWKPLPSQIPVLLCPAFEVACGGSRGGAKCLDLNDLVITPFGSKRAGDVSVGDTLISWDGGHTRVLAVYPQPPKPTYKMTFIDGASVTVDESHIWYGWRSCRIQKATRLMIDDNGESFDVRGKLHTTAQVLDYFRYAETMTNRDAPHFQIPLCKPVRFTVSYPSDPKKTLDPYVLGLLLGNGYMPSLSITINKADLDDVMEHLNRIGLEFVVSEVRDGCSTLSLRNCQELRETVSRLGIGECRSWEKFVPKQYSVCSIEDRLNILRGLLDTDGTVDDRGHVSYCSVSESLANDVAWLVRSLGGKATVTSGPAGYRDKGGEYRQCRDAYSVQIQRENLSELFAVSRKKSRCRDNFNGGISDVSRRLTNIESTGARETVCFVVDHPSSLFLTNDFIVTHNSEAGRAFMIKGNQAYGFPLFDELGKPILVNHSYIYHPGYVGLVLRRNASDMREWIEAAKRMYGPTGGEWIQGESTFRWEAGARIVTGHLDGPDAWEKYQGHEYQRMNIEELPQVPEERLYLMMFGSCRSKYPELKPQIFNSANPAGAGVTWYKQRFIKVNDERGEPIKKTAIFFEDRDRWTHKKKYVEVPNDSAKVLKLHESGKLTRCFIPMWLKDNEYLMSNQAYVAALESMPERERRAMLDGDWDAMVEGRYFEEFRERHLTGEPDEACHVTEPVELLPWWERWAGCDWGHAHETAVYWACDNLQDKRIHVYREFVTSGVEPFELGIQIAEQCGNDIINMESQTMPLYLSKDAFDHRRGANDPTIADLIAAGIKEYFGPGGCLIPNYVDETEMQAFYDAGKTLSPRIILHKVDASPGSRKAGAQYIRSLFRWWKVKSMHREKFDLKKADEMIEREGLEKYRRYIEKMREDDEVVPKVLIWKGCEKLIEQIPQILRDENDLEDYDTKRGKWDRYDAFRYCLHSHHLHGNAIMPKEQFIASKVRDQFGNAPVSYQQRRWLEQKAELEWKQKFGAKKFDLPIGRRARRGMFHK